MTPPLDPVLQRLDADLDGAVGRLTELLRIPSISTDPAYNADTRRAAEHVAADLAGIGFEAAVREQPVLAVLLEPALRLAVREAALGIDVERAGDVVGR